MSGPATDDAFRFTGWQIIEKLGEGGMCEVFRVRPAEGDGPERAVKVLMDRSDTAIRRFVDEAALLQRIDHPNVVKVHAIDAQARPPWLVMDLLGGRDLEDTIHVEGRMDPERAARMFADLANGLVAVHAAGVRHRDIKPANLRLGSDGIPRLIDFGIARDASAARHTKQGFVVGTAAYLPPEVFSEDDAQAAQDSETADVYALGQTLCEVLAGEVTHVHRRRAGTEASLLVQIMRDKLDREFLDPRDHGAPIPEELARIVQRATAREPEDRTPTARKLEAELRAFLVGRESIAEVAPLSRVDLPRVPAEDPGLPPGTEPGTEPAASGTPVPPPAPPVRPTSPPAPPAPRRGGWLAAMGAVGAAGMLGTGAIAVGVAVLLVSGVAALWVFRPPPPQPVDQGKEAVLAVVAGLGDELERCRTKRGELKIALTVEGGRATRTDVVSSSVEPRTERCAARILSRATYPPGPTVAIEVPVIFK